MPTARARSRSPCIARSSTRIAGRSRPSRRESVLEQLASIPPRDMRKLLLDAFGTAQLAGRDHLVPEDIDSRKLCGRRARVGF